MSRRQPADLAPDRAADGQGTEHYGAENRQSATASIPAMQLEPKHLWSPIRARRLEEAAGADERRLKMGIVASVAQAGANRAMKSLRGKTGLRAVLPRPPPNERCDHGDRGQRVHPERGCCGRRKRHRSADPRNPATAPAFCLCVRLSLRVRTWPHPPYMKRFRGLGSRRLGRAGDWEPTTVTALF